MADLASKLISGERHGFVEASAGSGKTTLLVGTIAEIIASGKATIGQILCVTFTEKAAGELKARVYAELRKSTDAKCRAAAAAFSDNRIGTIHNFCLRSLREDPVRSLADSAEGSVADDRDLFEEAREWVYRTVFSEFSPAKLNSLLNAVEFGKGGKDRDFDAEMRMKALYTFSADKARVIPEITEISRVKDDKTFKAFILASIVARMRQIATARNVMTFSRMVTLMAEAVQEPAFAEKIRSAYGYALVDEFQDTDPAQWQIFRTLFLVSGRKLIVVGDPKQAIYKFRGADVFVYLEARRAMEKAGAEFATLPVNYRSTPEILAVLDTVFLGELPASTWKAAGISYVPPAYGGQVVSTGDSATGAEFFVSEKYAAADKSLFAEVAVARLAEIRIAHPEWTSAVIAYRHETLREFAAVLQNYNIPYAYYKQKPEAGSTLILHLQVFLAALTLPPTDSLATAATTIFHSADAFSELAALAAQNRVLPLLSALYRDQGPLRLLVADHASFETWHSWHVLFRRLLALCGKDIFDMASLLKTLREIKQGDADESGEMLRLPGPVTLITVQSAKGLDWNAVVVADGINDKRWKNYAFFHDADGAPVVVADEEAFDAGDDKLMTTDAEARITQLNLLYVAMTRSKHKLIAHISPHFASQKPGPVSFFLTTVALPGSVKLKDAHIKLSAPEKEQLNFLRQGEKSVDHGNIAQRLSERTSFTAMANATFGEIQMLEDILPRGSETGQMLHDMLETCDFRALRNHTYPDFKLPGTYDNEPVRDRIRSILHATATATLPLTGNSGSVCLAEIDNGKLWREMPFWSSDAVHKSLSIYQDTVRRTMHGYMDLVFTADDRTYYILDYKSNSLSAIDPEKIGAYADEHYGLQAEIYREALEAYLAQNYPDSGKKVGGCYFLFLRYLSPAKSIGVHFMDLGNA